LVWILTTFIDRDCATGGSGSVRDGNVGRGIEVAGRVSELGEAGEGEDGGIAMGSARSSAM